jgi:amino acid adenylation domain-containing protein
VHDDLERRLAALSPRQRELLERRMPRPLDPVRPAAIPRRIGGGALAPASFAQQRLWVLHRIDPESRAYHIPAVVRLHGVLSVRALTAALARVIARHEILRTRLIDINGEAMQAIDAPGNVMLPVIDLSGLVASAAREASLARVLRRAAAEPFDLSRGPLLRVCLVREDAATHVLGVTMHHVVSDGWSAGVFIREWAALYEACVRAEAGEGSRAGDGGKAGKAGKAGALSSSTFPKRNAHAALSGATPHAVPESPELSQLSELPRVPELPELPALPVQYADFAVWQREWLSGAWLETALHYWRTRLTGAPDRIALPVDRARPARQSYRGAHCPVEMSAELWTRVRELSHREGVTPFMTALASVAVLLSRYSGQTDLVIGTPIANREQRELEPLIGCFANTLALRIDLSGDPPFTEMLRRVKALCLDAYAHQALPFERLVEELGPARDLSQSPLVQVLFAWQQDDHISAPASASRGPRWEGLAPPLQAAKFELSVLVTERADGLSGVFEYATDLFEADTITRWTGHWRTLLAGAVRTPSTRLSALPLLDAAEEAQVRTAWQGAAAELCSAPWIDLADGLAWAATQWPDAEAVRGDDGVGWSYRALHAEAARLAQVLRQCGVGPEVRVGVQLERSVALVVTLLAVLKAGGAYVPLEPAQPLARRTAMATDAAVQVVVTTGDAPTPVGPWRTLRLDADAAWIAQQPADDPPRHVHPDTAAYVIFTSGSTGRPKGAINTHAGVGNRLRWMQAAYQLTPGDRVVQKTPYGFDVSVWEFFWPLLTGATLVVAAPDGHRDSRYLVDLFAREAVTTAHFVPSMLAAWLEEPDVARAHALRQVFVSGEALPVAVQRRFEERLPHVALHNLYGPTEAAVDVTAWRCVPARPGVMDERVPLGRPITATQIYVVERGGALAPIGIPGELWIGGVQVARGYAGEPARTAERFVPDPFGVTPGARAYRTGDLGRWRADGQLDYLGRLDHQVKIRGQRIELGEIEAALRAVPGIQAAAVIAETSTSGAAARLIAYYVAAASQSSDANDETSSAAFAVASGATSGTASGAASRAASGAQSREPAHHGPAAAEDHERRASYTSSRPAPITEASLRQALREQLPDAMIPARFVRLAELPLTSNGKLDRRALPSPTAPPDDQTEYVAPRTPTEEMLAAIWADLLQLDRIGIHDNFFTSGGDSILAMRVVARANESGLQLTPRDLFQYQTIADLADAAPAHHESSVEERHAAVAPR